MATHARRPADLDRPGVLLTGGRYQPDVEFWEQAFAAWERAGPTLDEDLEEFRREYKEERNDAATTTQQESEAQPHEAGRL